MVKLNNKNLSSCKMEIRRLKKEELPIVRDLAYKIWPSTYSHIISQEQISYMLNWMYSIETLEISHDTNHAFFAVFDGDQALGFVDLELDNPDKKWLKLQKIYVLPEKQKLGLGLALMDYTVLFAQENGMKHITLQVNRTNKAVSFYERLGFYVADEQDFDIGNGYFMNDFVMQKDL
jgi:ribosomal protein S18 acetylase RimI-like enzyme